MGVLSVRIIQVRGYDFAPPPPFVFVRYVGFCTECGKPVRRDRGYILRGGGLGCEDCAEREQQPKPPAETRQQVWDRRWERQAASWGEVIERIIFGGVQR